MHIPCAEALNRQELWRWGKLGNEHQMSTELGYKLLDANNNTVYVDTIKLVHQQIVNSQEFDSRSGYSAVYPSSWAGLNSHITTVHCFVFLRQPALKIVLPVTTLSQSLSSILSPSLTFAIARARAGLDSGNCEQCKYEVYWQNTEYNKQ